MIAATFLGGASGRLLPMSVPFRYFGAAAAYHVLAWALLAGTGGRWVDFHGGLGAPLAALHLVTLGVLAMTALGAGAQLMPVATRQAAIGAGWLKAIWWVYTPAVGVLAFGMAQGSREALAVGATGVVTALAAWLVLMARHLVGSRGMPGVHAHAWGALACLAVVGLTGACLVALWSGVLPADRPWLVRLHVVLAPFGFMGLLSMGFSSILVPMFALSPAPSERAQLASFALAGVALALVCLSGPSGAVEAFAWLCGACAAGLHLVQMHRAMATGMRKDLGTSFVLVRFGWGALVLTLVVWGAMGSGVVRDPVPLIVLTALCWLASVLFGFLHRILPFLGALHAGAGRRRGPTASSLTHAGALKWHAIAHMGAWTAAVLALASGNRALGALAAMAALAGAIAFLFFYVHLVRRMRATP